MEITEIDTNTIEMLISTVCTHLIAAGVMKQIVDNGDKIKDVFCVSHFSIDSYSKFYYFCSDFCNKLFSC